MCAATRAPAAPAPAPDAQSVSEQESLVHSLEEAAAHVNQQWGEGSAIRQEAGAATRHATQAAEQWAKAAAALTDWASHQYDTTQGAPNLGNACLAPYMRMRVLTAMHTACVALTAPPAALYAGAGEGVTVGDGDLAEMGDVESQGGDAMGARAGELLASLGLLMQSFCSLIPHTLCGALAPNTVDDSDNSDDSDDGNEIGVNGGVGTASTTSVRHRPLIEVLDSSSDEEGGIGGKGTAGREQEELQQLARQLTHDLILLGLCWTYDQGLPGVWLVVVSGSDGSEQEPKSSTMKSAGTAGVCLSHQILQQLAAVVQTPLAKDQSAPARRNQGEEMSVVAVMSVGDLLVSVAGTLMPSLRQVVLSAGASWAASHKHDDVYVDRPPDATLRQRLMAAHQLSVMIRCLNHRQLSQVIGVALPAALAAAQDTSPVVSVQGMWALTYIATEGMSTDLRWQSDLLQDAATRMVVGCQDSAWRAACTCTTALICTLLGSDPRAPGYHVLMSEMLSEMERHGHKNHRRVAFLSPEVLLRMIQSMGLTVLRHTSRLLPLLLEWLQSYHLPSRTASACALHTLILHTWPRTPAHAPILWQHVCALCLREAADAMRAQGREKGIPKGQGTSVDSTQVNGGGASAGEGGFWHKQEDVDDAMIWLRGLSSAAAWGVRVVDLLVVHGGQGLVDAVTDTRHELVKLEQGQGKEQNMVFSTAVALVHNNPDLHPVLMALLVYVGGQAGGSSEPAGGQ